MRLGHCGELLKAGGIANGEIRQDLAIDPYAALLQAVHQLTVAEPVLPCRRIDARDPQTTKLSFTHLAIPVRIGQPFLERLARLPVLLAAAADVALGQLDDLLVTPPSLGAPLYSWHV